MENLLVTGGCGFIGTNFIRYLLGLSDFRGRIINIDKLTYAGNPENLADIAEQFKDRYVFHRIDICDWKGLAEVFDTYPIDAICHFAAESHVDRSIVGPAEFIQTNIVGTFNLLELARANLDRFVLFHHVSTDEVFGSLDKKGFFTEQTPYRPNSPYSASKAGSDHLVRAYHKTYGLPITVSNCSNNYGPYQFPEKLIPLMILNALLNKPMPVYGDGHHVRDWLFVVDHCKAVWKIMTQGKIGETYAVGGNCEMENIEVVRLICDLIDAYRQDGSQSCRDLITFVDDRPGHDRRYAISFKKINETLGWTPEESFESGIQKTIQWYTDHQEWIQRIKSGQYRAWMKQQYGMEA